MLFWLWVIDLSIGDRIKQAREFRGLSRAELSALLDITPSAISNYENDISSPRDIILYAIMKTLDVDANFIFQDVVPKSQANMVTPEGLRVGRLYDKADERTRTMVDLALEPFDESKKGAPGANNGEKSAG